LIQILEDGGVRPNCWVST